MEIAAIILAAGQGTRLKSALTKPLHRIGGRPMLAWSLDSAIAANASHIISVLPRQSEQIKDWLDGRDFCIQDKPLGTGYAVQAAAGAAQPGVLRAATQVAAVHQHAVAQGSAGRRWKRWQRR